VIRYSGDSLDETGFHPPRGLFAFYSDDPGVALRFTPGFMLSPRFAGSPQVFNTYSELPKDFGEKIWANETLLS